MNATAEFPTSAVQLYKLSASSLYPIDAAAHLARVPRHLILVYYKHGLITLQRDPEYGGYYFDAAAIRMLQRIAYLHQQCGINLTGVRMILDLMDEVSRLRGEL